MFWAQLKTSDLDAATSFYTDVLGWRVDVASDGPGLARGTFHRDDTDAEVAGVLPLSEWEQQQGEPSRWMPFVHTPDAIAMTERAQFHGAMLVEPAMPARGNGWRATLSDPSGADFGVWEPADDREHPSVDGPRDRPGDLAWAELQTTDAYASRDFYCEWLVWACIDDHPSDRFLGDDIRFVRSNQPIARLRPVSRSEVPSAPRWLPGFAVSDLETSVDQVVALGGTVHDVPAPVADERPAVRPITDPTGATCLLVGLSRDLLPASGRLDS